MTKQVQIGQVFKGSPSGKVVEAQGKTVDVPDDGVVIKMIYGSLCGTDLHMLKNDMVLGHEPVGIVSDIGPKVRKIRAGDRVGFGYNTDGCLLCRRCISGQDAQCSEAGWYGLTSQHQGGFGDTAVVREAFVHKIPDPIDLADAAPLQCGGITIFAAMVNADVKAWDRVGIVGIGGLGHMAIQFANKWGCEVTVFSSTSSKKDEAMRLGAHNFVAAKETPDFSTLGLRPLDHLFVTTSELPDWKQYLPVLADHASIVPLTVSMDELKVGNALGFISKEFKLVGSVGGGRGVHDDMLEFVARHGIKPMIEILPMDEKNINEGIERLEAGGKAAPRYRIVFENLNNKQYLKK